MAVSTVKASKNGQTYDLNYNSETDRWEKKLIAPGVINAVSNSKYYYPVTLTITDDAGNTTTKDDTDPTWGDNLKLIINMFKIDWGPDDYYNAEDFNRVENNTLEVVKLINELLGSDIKLEPVVTNRNYSSIEFPDSLNRIERNIEKDSSLNLNGIVPMKTTWKVGDSFSYRDANRLENNLYIIYSLLIKNIGNVPYCGIFNCGSQVI